MLAPDHPWLLSYIAGACATAGANIVDAQIYTTTDGMALDTIAVTREFDLDDDEQRRADRVGRRDREGVERRPAAARNGGRARNTKGTHPAFAIEPEVTINNQWSNRYTVVEIGGLDRPGLLYELTATLSKLDLNIASAHVATLRRARRRRFLRHRFDGCENLVANSQCRREASADRAVHDDSRKRRPSCGRRMSNVSMRGAVTSA